MTQETMTPPNTPQRARPLVYLRRLAAIVCVVYLVLCAAFYFLQDQIIFPGKATQGRADAVVAEAPTTRLIRLNLADGTPIVARYDLAARVDPAAAPTVLVFYGNGQCARTTGGVIYIFQQLGCNVLTPDYPGYGMSGGVPSEASLFAAADTCWKYLQSRTDIDHSQLHIVGWSLGSGVAIDLAARVRPRSLTTISAYTSMADMGRHTAPFLPVSLILRHPFRSIDKIAQVQCPILLIHGQRDTTIPPEMSRTLAARATSPVTTLYQPYSDHNDIFDTDADPLIAALARHLGR
ncbi:MAG: dienelactone hydrolase family protein [Burkholderiales bacterium]|nr:dienelactone hydrolase family protein [Phycisphaerae bacterium]